MDELRWILLGLGTLIIVGVYGYTRVQDWRRDGLPWRRAKGTRQREPFAGYDEPGLNGDDPLLGEDVIGTTRVVGREPEVDADHATAPQVEPTADEVPTLEPVHGEDKVVALSVMAPSNAPYPVTALTSVLEAAGLQRTEQSIFRRGLDTQEGTIALFSVANIIEPGTFADDPKPEDTVPGVALIMQLPGPFDGLTTFEQMLSVAQRIAGDLGGHVLDVRRCDLTHQAIEHIREDLLEYRRRARLASRRGQ